MVQMKTEQSLNLSCLLLYCFDSHSQTEVSTYLHLLSGEEHWVRLGVIYLQ